LAFHSSIVYARNNGAISRLPLVNSTRNRHYSLIHLYSARSRVIRIQSFLPNSSQTSKRFARAQPTFNLQMSIYICICWCVCVCVCMYARSCVRASSPERRSTLDPRAVGQVPRASFVRRDRARRRLRRLHRPQLSSPAADRHPKGLHGREPRARHVRRRPSGRTALFERRPFAVHGHRRTTLPPDVQVRATDVIPRRRLLRIRRLVRTTST